MDTIKKQDKEDKEDEDDRFYLSNYSQKFSDDDEELILLILANLLSLERERAAPIYRNRWNRYYILI